MDPKAIGGQVVGVVSAVIGVAIIAVILSQRATSASVITSFFSGLTSLVATAVSPITGQSGATALFGSSGSVIASSALGTGSNVLGSVSSLASGSSSLLDSFGGAGSGISSDFGGSLSDFSGAAF